MLIAEIVVQIVSIYGYIGLITGTAFLLFGIDRIVPSTKGYYLFRILLIPGVICLWPLILWRWFYWYRHRHQNMQSEA